MQKRTEARASAAAEARAPAGAKEAKSAEATYSRLNKLIENIAPGYDHKLFQGCHLANDLLFKYGRNVDLCIIAALQRYCLVVPPTEYPCAIRNWPWSDDEVERWVIAHKESSARVKLAYRVTGKTSLAGAKPTAGAVPEAGAAAKRPPLVVSSVPGGARSSSSGLAREGAAVKRPVVAVSSPAGGAPASSGSELRGGTLYKKWDEAP